MGTLTGGHYTAHVKDGIKNQWHLFDDSRIIATDESALKVQEFVVFAFRIQSPY
jgi:ubiquitin C-terminal hydrolase